MGVEAGWGAGPEGCPGRKRPAAARMVVAGGDGCQRGRRAAPRKTRPRPVSAGVLQGDRTVQKRRGEPKGNQDWGLKGGGGWAVPPPLRSLHQRRRSLGWSLSRVLWALCRRSPWRPLVASGGSKPPAGDTVRTGGGLSGTVRVRSVCCRCSRIASAVRAVALALRPLPRIHRPCPSPQGGTGGGPGAAGNGTPHVRRIREGTREVPLPPETCRATRGGLPSKRFALPLPLADAGGGGGRRDRRVAAAKGIRLGLALCEGQRCHALMGNKHRPCQTVNIYIYSMLSFFMKMCRTYLCNAVHMRFAQTACTCANLSVPAGAQTRPGHPPPYQPRRREWHAHPGTTHEAGRKTGWSPSGFGNWFAAVRMPAPSPAVTSCRMRRCIRQGALPD